MWVSENANERIPVTPKSRSKEFGGLVCMSAFMESSCLVAKLCPSLLRSHGLEPARLLFLWDFPGKNAGVAISFSGGSS